MARRSTKVPRAAISRLIIYLRILEQLEHSGYDRTSSEQLAEEARVTAFQVRKDLAYFGSYGTRGVGYAVPTLGREIRQILGLNQRQRLAIIGMGRLGQALSDYAGYGQAFEICGFFDRDPAKQKLRFHGRAVWPVQQLARRVRTERIDIGLITVPASAAQEIADLLVGAGVRGILNFAPEVLETPGGVNVENVDFVAGLTRLSFFMQALPVGEEMRG